MGWHVECMGSVMKTTTHSNPATSLVGRLVKEFFTLIERLVPSGYEDENGFHYGPQPRVPHIVRFPTETYARRPLGYRTRRSATSLRSR